MSTEVDFLPFVAAFLGFLCLGLLTVIVFIAIKRAKGCRGTFCFRRRVEDDVPSSAIINKRTAGCSSPPPQTSSSQEEETVPVYAAIDIKKKKDSMKKKSLRLDLVSAQKPTTYFGTDGTEYQTMTAVASDSRCTELKTDKSVTSPPPPKQQPRLFETSTYASIDHDLAVPQFKVICK